MAEYGDPEKPEEWEYLKNFSPLSERSTRSKVPDHTPHHLYA